MATDIRPYKERRTRGKGLRRSAKQWEETIARHIGKVVDNAKPKDIVDLIPMVGCGYLGYKAFNNPEWALGGMIGYKLATAQDALPSQVAGLSILATIGIKGLTAYNPYTNEEMNNVFGDDPNQYEYREPTFDKEQGKFTCPEGYELKIGTGGGNMSKGEDVGALITTGMALLQLFGVERVQVTPPPPLPPPGAMCKIGETGITCVSTSSIGGNPQRYCYGSKEAAEQAIIDMAKIGYSCFLD